MSRPALADRYNWLWSTLDKLKKKRARLSCDRLFHSVINYRLSLAPGIARSTWVAYHPEFDYPECELQTKRWFVETRARTGYCFDARCVFIPYYSILFLACSEGKV